MKLSSLIATVLFVALLHLPLRAGVTSIQIDSNPVPAVEPAGFVTNDIRIDFTGQYFGSQLLTEDLGTGAIFQQAAFGNDFAPNDALFGFVADLPFDSFTAHGGLTDQTKVAGHNLNGAAVNLMPGVRSPVFNDSQVDLGWGPAAGAVVADISDKSGFVTARLTLSDSVNGTFGYLASAGGSDDFTIVNGTITNGVMSVNAVPEPSAFLLLGLVGCIVGVRGYCKHRNTARVC